MDGMVELVRQGEATLERQYRMAEDHYKKSRHFLNLSGGVIMVGGLAAGLFVDAATRSFNLSDFVRLGIFVVLLGASFLFSGAAFRMFMNGYVGEKALDTALAGGGEAENLAVWVERDSSAMEVMVATGKGLARWIRWNSGVLTRLSRLRRRGVRFLWVGGVLLSLTLIYSAVVSFV